MNSVGILTSCEDERADYDSLRAASVLHDMSRGRDPGGHFPSPAELGEAAELLGLSGVGGWDHLFEEAAVAKSSSFHGRILTAKTSLNKGSTSKMAFVEATGDKTRVRTGDENQPDQVVLGV